MAWRRDFSQKKKMYKVVLMFVFFWAYSKNVWVVSYKQD